MLQDSVTTYETTSICDEKLINKKNQNTFTNSTFDQEICTIHGLKTELNKQILKFIKKKNKIETFIRDIEEETQKANKYLEKAQFALNKLNKKNLTKLRKLGKFGKWRIKSIPTAVHKAITAVMVLLSKPNNIISKGNSWTIFKIMVDKDSEFLNLLKSIEGKQIHPNIRRIIRPYLIDREFDINHIAEKSIAAASLCAWVINIAKFNAVWLTIKQKEKSRHQTTKNLNSVDNKIRKLKKMIKELNRNQENIKLMDKIENV